MSPEDNRLLGSIDGKLDMLLESHAEVRKVQADHAVRLTEAEGWRKQVLFLVSLCGLAGGFLSHYAAALFGFGKGS